MTREEIRAKKNKFYNFFYKIVVSVWFNFTIYILIFFNTLSLAFYRYDQSDLQTKVLNVSDYIFTVTFTVEMICKMIGLGLPTYLKDSFNVFDAIIVIMSLVDVALFVALGQSISAAMNAFRGLRLLRVIKLARIWKAFRETLDRIQQSLIDVSSFSVLLTIFVFIFALLGMQVIIAIIF